MKSYLPLLSLALLHAIVDMFAIVIEPLWPLLGQTFHLGTAGIAWLMTWWSITTSASQVVFGYFGDRYGTPRAVILGPLIAVIAISAVGVAPSSTFLFALLLIGGLGVGAFHPEAAVAASSIHPASRTRALSIFMCGGTLGLGLGPFVSGQIVHSFGLRGLTWLAAPGVAVVLFLAWNYQRFFRARVPIAPQVTEVPGPAPCVVAGSRHVGLVEVFRGKVGTTLLLLGVCAARVVPSVGMSRAMAYLLKARGHGEDVIGTIQSIFLLSGSIGMLLSAVWFRRGWEKGAMVLSPLLGIPLVLLIALPEAPTWLMTALLVPAGLVLAGTTPAMVSYSHQLLPRGRGLASSITMGLCWALSGVIVAALVAHYESLGRPEATIRAFAPFLAASGIAAIFLPRMSAPEDPRRSMRPIIGEAVSDPALAELVRNADPVTKLV